MCSNFCVRDGLLNSSLSIVQTSTTAQDHAKTNAPFDFADFAGVTAGTLYAPVAFAPPPTGAFPGETISDLKTSSIALADMLSFLQDSLLVGPESRL